MLIILLRHKDTILIRSNVQIFEHWEFGEKHTFNSARATRNWIVTVLEFAFQCRNLVSHSV